MATPTQIRTQLASALGSNGLSYWKILKHFLVGNLSRIEFDEVVRRWINTPDLITLHNSLLVAIVTAAAAPPSQNNNTTTTTGPPRKKRRLLPHQDAPPLLTRWALGIGKNERHRIRNSAMKRNPAARGSNHEILKERPIRTMMEGKYRPGAHVPLPLGSITRTLPTTQHLTDRMVLIAAQHAMTASKPAASLLSAAVEAYLKQITMHALSTTSTSQAFTSISPSEPTSKPVLSMSSFDTLFTLAPFENPAISASTLNLPLNSYGGDEEEDDMENKYAWDKLDAPARQMMKLVLGTSGMRALVESGASSKLIKL